MLKKSDVLNAITEYCKQNNIDANKAKKQLVGIGNIEAICCVPNPNAPTPNGLANDIDTLMLPTLYIRPKEKTLEVIETEYTNKFLRN